MSKTTLATGNAQTAKAWSEKVFRETRKASYFSKFMGGDEALVREFTELTSGKGDTVNVPLIQRMTSAGVTSGSTLEGAEDNLTFANYQLILEQYRNAIRDDGKMTRKRAGFDVKEESKSALKVWGGEKIDALLFSAGQTSLTSITYRAGGTLRATATSATASAALTSTDVITPRLISATKTMAETGFNRRQNTLAPIMVDGSQYWIMLVHPDAGDDLRNDSTWNQANREAQQRGEKNPIFQNALGVWSGVIVHTHENIGLYTNGGASSNVPYCTNLFMGANALAWAWGEREQIVYKTFDFDNEEAWAWGIIASAGKPQFTFVSSSGSASKDHAVIGVYTARTQTSDITFV